MRTILKPGGILELPQINIPFNEWSRNKLAFNKKSATTRRKKYGDIGDTFKVLGESYIITLIIRCRLSFVREFYYEKEGCGSRDEFELVWRRIHPVIGYAPDQLVWLHLFDKVI